MEHPPGVDAESRKIVRVDLTDADVNAGVRRTIALSIERDELIGKVNGIA